MALSADATALERAPSIQSRQWKLWIKLPHITCWFTGDVAECGPQREGSSRKLSREVD